MDPSRGRGYGDRDDLFGRQGQTKGGSPNTSAGRNRKKAKTGTHGPDSASEEGDTKPPAVANPAALFQSYQQHPFEDSLLQASPQLADLGLLQGNLLSGGNAHILQPFTGSDSANMNDRLALSRLTGGSGWPQSGMLANFGAASAAPSDPLSFLTNSVASSPRDVIATSRLGSFRIQQQDFQAANNNLQGSVHSPSTIQRMLRSSLDASQSASTLFSSAALPSFASQHQGSQFHQLISQLQLPFESDSTATGYASLGPPIASELNSYQNSTQANLIEQRLNELQQTAVLEPQSTNQLTLALDEDVNWLSEFQCFIRSDLIEVIQADQQDVFSRSTSKSVDINQVGIRCRFCSHFMVGQRASRSSAFPSSIRQLYQSFTMMQRDHLGNCIAMPVDKKQRYLDLQNEQRQGACDSKQYWIYSAKKIGMFDTEFGIAINDESRAAALDLPGFGTTEEGEDPARAVAAEPVVLLIRPEEISETTPFVYSVLTQLQLVYLLQAERVGKRRTLPLRLKGFGCRHCCAVGRLGFSRSFPLRRRTLPQKVNDMFHHLRRCTLCPDDTKALLIRFYQGHELETRRFTPNHEKAFYDKLWKRLGRDGDITT